MSVYSLPLWLGFSFLVSLASIHAPKNTGWKNLGLSIGTVSACVGAWGHAAASPTYMAAWFTLAIGVGGALLLLALNWEGIAERWWNVHVVQLVGGLAGYVAWLMVSNAVQGPVPDVHTLSLGAAICTMLLTSIFVLPIVVIRQRRGLATRQRARIEAIDKQRKSLVREGVLLRLRQHP